LVCDLSDKNVKTNFSKHLDTIKTAATATAKLALNSIHSPAQTTDVADDREFRMFAERANITHFQINLNNEAHLNDLREHMLKTARSLLPQDIQDIDTALNTGFFLKIYLHPVFRHWLTQLLLALIVITAASVIAAFLLNASLLPLAVTGVVKSFSTMVAQTIFGSAVVIETTAMVTLATSLHARFFSEPKSVPSAIANIRYVPQL